MKCMKLQQDILRACEKELVSRRKNPYMYGIREGYTDVCVDGSAIFVVPDAIWFLDTRKVFRREPFDTKRFFDKITEDPLEKTGIIKNTPGQGRKTRALSMLSGEHGNVWIDTAYTIYFDQEATYTGLGGRDSVYVWESGVPVGMIMPVYMGGD